jgi:hypothetical protein
MTSRVAALLAAADTPGRPVICLEHLAGEDPHVTSIGYDPAPPPRVLTFGDYRRLIADLRAVFVVEVQETISTSVITAGRHFARALERPETKPQVLSGYVDIDGTHLATSWMVDSAGQETITIYRDLATIADAEAYWQSWRREHDPMNESIHG